MRRNAGDYVKSWGAASIRGAATNPEFTVDVMAGHSQRHDIVVLSTVGSSSVNEFTANVMIL